MQAKQKKFLFFSMALISVIKEFVVIQNKKNHHKDTARPWAATKEPSTSTSTCTSTTTSQVHDHDGLDEPSEIVNVVADVDVHVLVNVDGFEKTLPEKQEVANVLHKEHKEPCIILCIFVVIHSSGWRSSN
jgi:hypothetical protein